MEAVRGWIWPLNTTKWHYAREVRVGRLTACRNVTLGYEDVKAVHTTAPVDSGRQCKRCRELFAKDEAERHNQGV